MAIYSIQNQWGGNTAPWNDRGVFVLGNRLSKKLVAIDISSEDNGKTLTGTITYETEGPIGFKASTISGVDENNYAVENSWGGTSGHDGGKWLIGSRGDQRVISLKATADADGNLNGQMTYTGEGEIGLKATLTPGNAYWVENSWGGSTGNAGGVMVLGTRATKAPVAFDLSSNDDGNTLDGTMTYNTEGHIGFKGTLNPLALNTYAVENSWGGTSGHDGGQMVIGARVDQKVVMLKVSSDDQGKTLTGDMQYTGEGNIGFVGNPQST